MAQSSQTRSRTRSQQWFERAQQSLVEGVNSPSRGAAVYAPGGNVTRIAESALDELGHPKAPTDNAALTISGFPAHPTFAPNKVELPSPLL